FGGGAGDRGTVPHAGCRCDEDPLSGGVGGGQVAVLVGGDVQAVRVQSEGDGLQLRLGGRPGGLDDEELTEAVVVGPQFQIHTGQHLGVGDCVVLDSRLR